jgi:hypothetical protein
VCARVGGATDYSRLRKNNEEPLSYSTTCLSNAPSVMHNGSSMCIPFQEFSCVRAHAATKPRRTTPFLFPNSANRQPLNVRAPLRPFQPRLSARAPRRKQVTKASAHGSSPIIDAHTLRCVALSPRFAKASGRTLIPPHTLRPRRPTRAHPYPAVRFHRSCLAGSPRGPLNARAHAPTARAPTPIATSLSTIPPSGLTTPLRASAQRKCTLPASPQLSRCPPRPAVCMRHRERTKVLEWLA